MKTVIHQMIDGFDVVRGFGEAAIDPVALSQKVTPVLATTDEAAACTSLTRSIDAVALAQSRATTKETWQDAQRQLEDLSAKWPPLAAALDAKRKALAEALDEDPAVHFTPGGLSGIMEDFLKDDQFSRFAAIEAEQADNPQRCAIAMDYSVIPDNRGTVYWVQDASGEWESTLIGSLGATVPEGATLDSAITADQRATIATQAEAARVAALSPDSRLAEATAAQQAAKDAVVTVQTEVSAGVTASADLSAAQATYAATLAEINAKYGTALK